MIVDYLLYAWILSLFNVDNLVINAFNELFGLKITIASYYFMFLILGVVNYLCNYSYKMFKIKYKNKNNGDDLNDL